MTIAIESIVLCLVFTLMVYLMSRDPIKTIYNYPPNIQERVKSLPEYQDQIPTQILSLVLRYVNGCTTFKDAFLTGFLLWTIVNAYDAIVMDIIWFCHDPYFVIKGTEDMTADYHDYMFHIKGSLIGEVLALVVCALAGLVVQFILK